MSSKLIFIQWTNGFGGLEKITQIYEEIFEDLDPLVVILRYEKVGLKYRAEYKFRNTDKIFFIFEYCRLVSEMKGAIYHIQYAGSFIPLFTYLAGARKIIFHFHGTMFPNKFIHRLVWKFLQKKVIIISNTLHTQFIIKKKLNIQHPIHNIPNFINLTKFKFYKRNYKNGKFIVTYAGRFAKGKNTDLIIETAKIIKSLDEDIEFLLVGDGEEKVKLKNLIEEYSLYSKVKLLPFTDEIVSVYQKSNLFLFLSSFESFGNVVAEAVLSGLPILCYKIPALEELINDKDFFIESIEPKLVADKIREIKGNYTHINQKLEKVNTCLRDYLDNHKNLEKLRSIYKQMDNI